MTTTPDTSGTYAVDAHAVRMFRNEQKRHADATLAAMREARDTLTRALTAWQGNEATGMLASETRRAATFAADAARRAEALDALHDVEWVIKTPEPRAASHAGQPIDPTRYTP